MLDILMSEYDNKEVALRVEQRLVKAGYKTDKQQYDDLYRLALESESESIESEPHNEGVFIVTYFITCMSGVSYERTLTIRSDNVRNAVEEGRGILFTSNIKSIHANKIVEG
jgi:hypothetical protein